MSISDYEAKGIQKMKGMICRELGGACDLEFQADTFDEITKMSQKHGKEMFKMGDLAHIEAMNKLGKVMQTSDEIIQWIESKRKEFEAKSDNKYS